MQFRALQLFAFLQVLAGIACWVGAVIVLLIMGDVVRQINDAWGTRLTASFGLLLAVGLFLAGLGSMAYGQFLEVVMKIEENTRPR